MDGSFSLEISLNGQQYSQPMPFLSHLPPKVVSLSPSSGPAEGGTRVNISGTAFTRFSSQICQFGPQRREYQTSMRLTSTVLASGTDASLRECVSRSAEQAIIGSTFHLRDEMRMGNLTLLGSAYALSGVTVVLNTALLSSVGSLVLHAPRIHTTSLPFFRVVFDIEAKNSLKGEGFSWSYASHIDKEVGAEGVISAGLVVSFRQWPSCQLRVTLFSSLLFKRGYKVEKSRTDGDHCWLAPSGAARLTMAFNASGLLVHSNVRGTVVDGLALPKTWVPRMSWVTAFGASSGRHTASFQLVDAQIDFGAKVTPQLVPLEIAQNGQQFTSDEVAFNYYPSPVVSSILPSHGPPPSGLFSSPSLGGRYPRCRRRCQ